MTDTLGAVARPDFQNVKQVTYNGAPLYYFIADRATGDANGQGSKAFGANWQVVTVGG